MRITIERKTGKEDKDGQAPLYLRVTHKRKQRYLGVGYSVTKKEWDPGRTRVRGRTERAAEINAALARAVAEAEQVVRAMRINGQTLSAEAVRDAVGQTLAPEQYGEPEETGDFVAFARGFVEGYRKRGQHRTYKKMNAVMNKLVPHLQKHAGEPRRLPIPERTVAFDRITPTAFRKWKDLLMTPVDEGGYGNAENTVAVNVKVARTVVKAAVREGLMERDPTQAVRLRERNAERARLSRAEVERLVALGPEDGVREGWTYRPGRRWPSQRWGVTDDSDGAAGDGSLLGLARDMWLFSMYLAGIRFGDVAEMRFEYVREIDGQLRLVYRMGKTDDETSLPLIAPARAIYERYAEARAGLPETVSCGRIFPVLDGKGNPDGTWSADNSGKRSNGNRGERTGDQVRSSAISSANALINKQLKQLDVLIGRAESKASASLTFHMARHTWADLARQSDWQITDIQQALGHASPVVTARYLASFDRDRLDDKFNSLF